MSSLDLVNKRFTLGTLANISGVDEKIKEEWFTISSLLLKRSLDSYSNGRVNHHLLQDAINDLSNGIFSGGGQGKGKADCYFEGGRVETKAYNSKDKEFHVAASSFFARNCKVPQYRKLLEEDSQKAKEFVFAHSYDGNDYYLLTRTSKLTDHLKDIELIFLEKKKLIKCLEGNFLKARLEKVYEQVKELEV